MSLDWQRLSVDAKEAGDYRILKCSYSGRYLSFRGKTTKNSMCEVLDGADTAEEAMAICEAHADLHAVAA